MQVFSMSVLPCFTAINSLKHSVGFFLHMAPILKPNYRVFLTDKGMYT